MGAAVLLAVAATASFAGAVPTAFGAPPSIVSLSSPSHPDVTSWYSDHVVTFTWKAAVLVVDGSSTAAGVGASPGMGFAAQTAALLPPDVQVSDVAVPGSTLADMAERAPVRVDPAYRAGARIDIVLLHPGRHELALGTSVTDVEQLVTDYALARRQAGFKVCLMTLLADPSPPVEAARLAFNDWLRAIWPTFADGLADVAADPRLGSPGACFDPAFFATDHLHPNDAGAALMAAIVASALHRIDPPGHGYSYAIDQDPGGVPDATAESQGAWARSDALPDGSWYVHVRALDGEGGAGPAATLPVNIDGAAAGPVAALASSTHPLELTWVSDADPQFTWAPDPVSPVPAGYSSRIDADPLSLPDDTIDTVSPGTSFTALADGQWYFHVRPVNTAGHAGPTMTRSVCIDTAPPTPHLRNATVVRTRRATLAYRVGDAVPGSPTATVTFRVRSAAGRVVKTIVARDVSVNATLHVRFVCRLRKGVYGVNLDAVDAAGNPGTSTAGARLTVR